MSPAPDGRRRFEDRVCLVTGSTGMAASAARALAAEGGAVFVVSRTAEHAHALADEILGAGGRAAWAAADLAREDAVDAAVAAAVETFGRLDVLYGVAGISGRRFGDGPLHEVTLAGWEAVMAANATSQFLVSRAAIRQMLRQEPREAGEHAGGTAAARDAGASGAGRNAGASGTATRGVLLLMSSTLASDPVPAHFATHAYAASKGAIDAFARSVAAHYAPHGIRVNAIAPSLVATPMSRRAQDDPTISAYLAAKQPLAGGPMDAEAVTDAALFLLSDDARMVTGQVVRVDGGWSVSEPR